MTLKMDNNSNIFYIYSLFCCALTEYIEYCALISGYVVHREEKGTVRFRHFPPAGRL